MGEYDRAQFEAAFAAQAQGLIEGGVDLISIETMYSLEEALAALSAVRRISSLPVVASMTFDRNPRGFYTLMGETVERCMRALVDEGADVVGSNCSHGSAVFVDLARAIRAATDAPVIVQPNRGQPEMEGDGVVYRQPAKEFAADAAAMLALGVDVIGGCCGTDPAFIASLRTLPAGARRAAAGEGA
jgi:5-methyltetrahydrofolate--homocysteine methyltransferase